MPKGAKLVPSATEGRTMVSDYKFHFHSPLLLLGITGVKIPQVWRFSPRDIGTFVIDLFTVGERIPHLFTELAAVYPLIPPSCETRDGPVPDLVSEGHCGLQ